jgi:hypothetical protein
MKPRKKAEYATTNTTKANERLADAGRGYLRGQTGQRRKSMPKPYIKEKIPAGKYYRALWYGKPSKKKFATATAAKKYAEKWRRRYVSLKFAEIKGKKNAQEILS